MYASHETFISNISISKKKMPFYTHTLPFSPNAMIHKVSYIATTNSLQTHKVIYSFFSPKKKTLKRINSQRNQFRFISNIVQTQRNDIDTRYPHAFAWQIRVRVIWSTKPNNSILLRLIECHGHMLRVHQYRVTKLWLHAFSHIFHFANSFSREKSGIFASLACFYWM